MTVTATKRKDIPHLRDMNDYEFAYWLHTRTGEWHPCVHLKLDGFFGKIGKDKEGKFFFQTARSGILRSPSEIVWHALNRGYEGEHLVRAKNMCEMFIRIENSSLVREMPEDTMYECEFFYKPMAQIEGDKITFVSVPYALDFFTSDLTIFVHKGSAASGDDEFRLRFKQHTFSGNINMLPSELELKGTIDLQPYINAVRLFPDHDILTLRSKSYTDRATKLHMKGEMMKLKESLTSYLVNHPNVVIPHMGDYHEGLVYHINNKQYKVITHDYWKKRHATV